MARVRRLAGKLVAMMGLVLFSHGMSWLDQPDRDEIVNLFTSIVERVLSERPS